MQSFVIFLSSDVMSVKVLSRCATLEDWEYKNVNRLIEKSFCCLPWLAETWRIFPSKNLTLMNPHVWELAIWKRICLFPRILNQHTQIWKLFAISQHWLSSRNIDFALLCNKVWFLWSHNSQTSSNMQRANFCNLQPTRTFTELTKRPNFAFSDVF